MRATLSLIAICVGFATCGLRRAAGENFHVAMDGRDTHPGSLALPWRTIQQAVDRLRPGDTLRVRAGVYSENVTLRASGRPGQPIVIRSFEGERVILKSGSFFGQNCSHLRLEGFRILDTRGDRPAIEFSGSGGFVEIVGNEIQGLVSRNAAALRVGGTIHDFLIATNHVHHNDTGNQEAIRVHNRTHDFKVLGNLVTDNSNIGIDIVGWAQFGKPFNGLVRGNRTHDNARRAPWASGIYLDGPDSIIVEHNISSGQPIGIQFGCEPANDSSKGNVLRHNLVHDNTEYGFSIGGYTGGTVHHCLIHNNVFANNKREIGFSRNAGHHNTLVNNILFNPGGQSINYLSQPDGTVIDFNCYRVRHGATPGANSIQADPRFVDAAGKNFRLLPGSPCIDSGMVIGPGVKDLDGRAGVRPDIGAFEFVPNAGR